MRFENLKVRAPDGVMRSYPKDLFPARPSSIVLTGIHKKVYVLNCLAKTEKLEWQNS